MAIVLLTLALAGPVALAQNFILQKTSQPAPAPAAEGGDDVFVPISKYIAAGNAEALSAWFADNLEIAVLAKESDASRAQARQIVKTFFDNFTPRSFNITHTGLLAADGNPQELWKVLGRLAVSVPGFREELRIRLVGKVDQEVLDSLAAAGLSENVVLLGPQKHAQAVREQRSASLLLLPLRNDEQYAPILPGKLFEYLAARRPILGVGQEEGAMAQLIFKARAGITADWENPAPMQAFIANAWRQHCGGGIPATDGDITPYTRQNLTKELAQLLEKVSENE